MLEVGGFRSHDCQGFGRRAFVKAGLCLPAAGALSGAAGASETIRARSIVLLWLWGAPSHVDTFDPKPDAPSEYRGPFSTIATRTTGVRFSELLPQMAQRSDRFALIRSHKNFHIGHLQAGSIALTGGASAAEPFGPNFGSILGRHRGGAGDFPPFVSMSRGPVRDVVDVMKGFGGGTWGRGHDPFMVECTQEGEVRLPSLNLLDGLGPERLEDRRLLLREVDRLRRSVERSAAYGKWDQSFRRAYALLTSAEARQAFDLTREPQSYRQRYGRTSFGQSCLLARRLVEAEVPYIQVNFSQYVEAMTPNTDFGWDTHIFNNELLADRLCPILDRAYCALLDDLEERGLLASTLVVCMGEFGRTPKINAKASRDHWPNCYSSIWAGAGVRAGMALGESDRIGAEPVTEPITPSMMGATMLELAGVGSVARAELRVLGEGRVLHELVS